ncbi:zinc finger and BTB domain-containing protein 17-like isoform X2 [Ischnura elegans]|uniref:zinc finger and BTB domain-containing protein 17-like isoform X2 n=1 Tax=Ischnura elegans TaxID=197161 RepID=UPI001ED886E6|nr:zinc finger and BTB domain-containing protein 17-like isoform X2 [Ischnura elegans]
MASDQFCLRWNNFQSSIITNLECLKSDEELVDVTLSCEGKAIKAHKLILSACSSYFKAVFKENPCAHPVVILKGVSFTDITSVISFMYQGEVHIAQDKLESFLRTAELLEVRGLADVPSANISDLKRKENEDRISAADHTDPPKSPDNLPSSSSPNHELPSQYEGQASPSCAPSSKPPTYYGPPRSPTPPVPYQAEPNMVKSGESVSAPESESGEVDEMDSWSRDGKPWEMVPKQEPMESMGSETSVLPSGVRSEEGTQSFEWHNLSASGSESSNQNIAARDQGSHFLEHLSSRMPHASINQDRGSHIPCSLCNKLISNRSNLLKHMKIRHSTGATTEKCHHCGKVFKNMYSLKYHCYMYHRQVR